MANFGEMTVNVSIDDEVIADLVRLMERLDSLTAMVKAIDFQVEQIMRLPGVADALNAQEAGEKHQ